MIIIFDRKQDFYDLAPKNGLLYFLLKDFRDNWCAPPDGVPPLTWFNILAEILMASFQLRVAAEVMFSDLLQNPSIIKNNKSGYPTLKDVLRQLFVIANTSRASSRETSLKLAQRIKSLLSQVGEAATSQERPDWKRLNRVDWALNLAGLTSSLQTLCITIYFAKVLLYRVCNNLRSDNLETLIVLDEASVIFPKTATKKTSILLDYFQQARAFGIGVIFASQSMNLADEVFANTAIKVAVGGFGHSHDFEAFGSAVGQNRPQREFMRTISQPGAAVVKDIRHPHPFTVSIDRPEPFKTVTIQKIQEISRKSRIALYGHDFSEETTVDSASPAPLPDRVNQEVEPKPAETEFEIIYRQPAHTSKPYQNAVRIIRAQANHGLPFLFRQEAALVGKVKGGASLVEAEKEALRHNLIIKLELPRAKTIICLWEITDHGYKLLEQQPPKWKSKGKYKHKFCVYRIKESFERQGYKGEIEHRRPNGKLVDLLLSREQEIIHLEVCCSWPISKEIRNVTANLEGEPLPSEIIMAVAERKMKKPLEKLIGELIELTPLSRPVRVVLAGDLIDFLEKTR